MPDNVIDIFAGLGFDAADRMEAWRKLLLLSSRERRKRMRLLDKGRAELAALSEAT